MVGVVKESVNQVLDHIWKVSATVQNELWVLLVLEC
jgi:hypothetical protein